MDGPPGTGKSEMIANIIAEIIGTVRRSFVSEKAAGLDVVYSVWRRRASATRARAAQ